MNKRILLFFFAMATLFALAGETAWETDMAKAKQRSRQENKPILINFSGSDWCGWCKLLDREVFAQKSFAQFADENLVLLQVDFPRYKDQSEGQQRANQELAAKFGVQGFPTVLLVNADDKVLLSTGYLPGGSEAYVKHLRPHLD